jgi:hypothetical protein
VKRLLICLALVLPSIGSADVIVQNLTGTGPTVLTDWFGQGFTTPSGGGGWDALSFNWYTNYPPVAPSAAGTAYLLSEVYTGAPSGLASAAGLIAASTGVSGGVYFFAPDVTILPNTTYWIYEDTAIPTSGGNLVAGEPAYESFGASSTFGAVGGTANFTLSGTATVPEPASGFLMLAALAAGLGLQWRRRSVRDQRQ